MSCSTSKTPSPSAVSSCSSTPSRSLSASSRPEAGSSRSSKRGPVARARAISTRRADPVGRSPAVCSAKSLTPTFSSRLSTVSSMFVSAASSAATRTLSRTVSELNNSRRWKVRARPRLARRCGASFVTSTPLTCTEPAVGSCIPLMTLNRVVLPAPLGPIRPVTSPA